MGASQRGRCRARPRIGRTRHGVAVNFRYALTLQAKPPRRCLTQGVPAVIVYQASKRQFIHDTFLSDIGSVLPTEAEGLAVIAKRLKLGV